jgi:branched-chain amino acid transport system ATP-binding protein
MLEIKGLETGYGKKQVLFGLTLEVRSGEIVALIGPNGAGKSTVLKAVCGLIPVWGGEISYRGTILNGSKPAQNVPLGIVYAPQGNRVFDELTVRENLEIGGFHLSGNELRGRIDAVLEMFPILKGRLSQEAGQLSGGEQQMLAIARALIPQPQFLMLDEPSLGFSPNLVAALFERIARINRELGVTILIVEQKVREVLDICHRVYSLKLGRVAFVGTPEILQEDRERLRGLFL